jgi:hypothetical protein
MIVADGDDKAGGLVSRGGDDGVPPPTERLRSKLPLRAERRAQCLHASCGAN